VIREAPVLPVLLGRPGREDQLEPLGHKVRRDRPVLPVPLGQQVHQVLQDSQGHKGPLELRDHKVPPELRDHKVPLVFRVLKAPRVLRDRPVLPVPLGQQVHLVQPVRLDRKVRKDHLVLRA
jgi:hypothetical protein